MKYNIMAIILGIETSCDETGIAIYQSNKGLLANVLYSQIDLHNLYGGVVPELASRDHIRHIGKLVEECITHAKISKTELDAIAYTFGPGLNGALLVGAAVANGMAFSLNKPVIPIHHLEGHILSTFLSQNPPPLPFIALLVSGGHSQLILVEKIGKYTLLGETLDDAAGETFDKSAKMLGLPYPGGKYIAKYASLGKNDYNLPRPMINSNNLDMSFSGLKTAVLTLTKRLANEHNLQNNLSELPISVKYDIAKSVEEAITDLLVAKTSLACKQTNVKTVVVSGGVSANLRLRAKFNACKDLNLFYPPLEFCTDSGAMIAIAGERRYQLAKFDYSFKIKPRIPLTDL